jgi:hypothetical protein
VEACRDRVNEEFLEGKSASQLDYSVPDKGVILMLRTFPHSITDGDICGIVSRDRQSTTKTSEFILYMSLFRVFLFPVRTLEE